MPKRNKPTAQIVRLVSSNEPRLPNPFTLPFDITLFWLRFWMGFLPR